MEDVRVKIFRDKTICCQVKGNWLCIAHYSLCVIEIFKIFDFDGLFFDLIIHHSVLIP